MRRTVLSCATVFGLVLAACGGGGDEASGCSPPDSELQVGALDELKFDSGSYEAEAGCIDVTYANEGNIAHTLLVRGKSGFKLAVGDTDNGTVELPAGSYELYCDVAGHEDAGMVADLVVG